MSTQSAIAPAPPAAPTTPIVTPAFSAKTSVQEYLDMECESEIRHEYVRGKITSMPGGTPAHYRISLNCSKRLDDDLEASGCEVFGEIIRLRVAPDQYRYPDLMVVCNAPQFDNENPPCLLNPDVIIEILSHSTQAIDRGDKLFEYRQIPSLKDYVLIAQSSILVAHHIRLSANEWKLTYYDKFEDALSLNSIHFTMPLRDIYRRTPLVDMETASPDETSA